MNALIPLFGLLCMGIFALGFGGGGVFLIYFTRKNQKRADASQGWPSTSGTIIDTDINRTTQDDSDGNSQYSYSPRIHYSYKISDIEYVGDKLTFGFGQSFGSEVKAQQKLAEYPVGKQVTVYYDPAEPVSAVLERKAGGSIIGFVLGGVFILLGLCMACPIIFTIPPLLTGILSGSQ